MELLEERKKKLAAEGLFDEARKQLLPFLPNVIGVVTSPTGAVIRDILHRLADRFPRHVLVWPVRVQGEASAAEVAAAIRGFNALPERGPLPRPDLIIVARGGGSLEDLWSFNEEIVVRAAAESMIPLISAVGHETDITLIDFAADRRAPTPTAAAEMAVPVRAELLAQIAALARARIASWQRGRRCAAPNCARRRARLPARRRIAGLAAPAARSRCARRLPRALHRQCATASHRISTRAAARLTPRLLKLRLARSSEMRRRARNSAANARQREPSRSGAGIALRSAGQLLTAFSYRGVLARGFALVRDGEGHPLRSAAAVSRPNAARHRIRRRPRRRTADGEGAPPPTAARAKPRAARRRRGRAGQPVRGVGSGCENARLKGFTGAAERLSLSGPSKPEPMEAALAESLRSLLTDGGEAEVKFLDGDFRVVRPGAFVRCAVTGVPIPLEELKYWSVDLQEAYVSPEAVLQRASRRSASGRDIDPVSVSAAQRSPMRSQLAQRNCAIRPRRRPPASPAAHVRARGERRQHRLARHARQILFGRHQHEAVALGRMISSAASSARVAVVIGKRLALATAMPASAASRKTCPDRRCRRRPAPARRRAPRRSRVGHAAGRETPASRARGRDDVAGARHLADHQQRVGARELRVERRPQRPGGKHPAVADAAPAVDHRDREILGQRRILQAVVHDDDAGAGSSRGLARPRRGRAPRRSARRAPAAAARRRLPRRDRHGRRPASARPGCRHSRG